MNLHGDGSQYSRATFNSTSWLWFTVHHSEDSQFSMVKAHSTSQWLFTVHHSDESQYSIAMVLSTICYGSKYITSWWQFSLYHDKDSQYIMVTVHSTSWWQYIMVTVHSTSWWWFIMYHLTVQSISWWQFTIHYGDSSEYTIWMAHSTSWWWVILHPSHSSQYIMAWACLHQPVNSVAFRILWGTHTLFLLVNKDILAQPNYNDRQLKSTNFVIRIRNKLWKFASPEIISDCLFLLTFLIAETFLLWECISC